MRRREYERGGASGQMAHKHRTLAAGFVEDGPDVIYLVVQRRHGRTGNGIGHANATVVVHDQPGERGQPTQVTRQ
jgi:hypothetical protein